GVAERPVPPYAVVPELPLELCARLEDGALGPVVPNVRLDLHADGSPILERVLQQQEFALGVHHGPLQTRRIPRPTDLDALLRCLYVHIAGTPDYAPAA